MPQSSCTVNPSLIEQRVPYCLEHVTAVILAGGMGSRLRPVIADRSKVMAPVNGVPFLIYVLEHLLRWGIRQVVLCTGVFAESISSWFGSSYRGLSLAYSDETSPLGTGGALRHAMKLVPSFPILGMNGDSFFDLNFEQFLDWHSTKSGSASIALTHVDQAERYGAVEIDSCSAVTAFVEKGQKSGPAWVNAGVYLLEQPFLESIPAQQGSSLESDIFPQWMGRGLYGYRSEGKFLDIGTPSAYGRAEGFFSTPVPLANSKVGAGT